MDGVPRPLVILASLAQATPPLQLLDWYRAEGTQIVKKGRRGRDMDFDHSTRLSINCLTMQQHPHALEILRLIAILPDGAEKARLEEMFPTMTRQRELGEATRTLLQLALVEDYFGYLKVLAPIRNFMQHRYPPAQAAHWQELEQYYERLAQSGVHVGKSRGAECMKRPTKEFRNVVTVMRHALTTSTPPAPLIEAIVESARFAWVAKEDN
ncbi:hypothetical protein DACRYDRAFT_21703 [Dacryopinax primogenitus]|uniref:Uncharacterized protein n=1 Tax=Dacryopinax primogenitus (strain DJM 731) TaxID=1858805 RepID=M5G3A3_DACPD|nr:uncharacterized protein DACRYDRAFT_21703 [Dacryopinax primogenitus]EJU02695.1 hypothetical protein DACRYDRAFT_21703 [Dacryopinax primogenitus]